MTRSKEWKLRKKSTKGEHLFKNQLGQMLTVSVMSENEKEDNPPHPPTPRRAALESARQEMQAIRVIGQPEEKNACCMALVTLRKSEKYSRNTLGSTLCSGHTLKSKPAPVAKNKRSKTVKFNSQMQEVNVMVTHAAPITIMKKGNNRPTILRVRSMLRSLQRINAIMVLTA